MSDRIPYHLDLLYVGENLHAIIFHVYNRIGVANEITRIIRIRGLNIYKVFTPYPAPLGVEEAHIVIIVQSTDPGRVEEVAAEVKDLVKPVISYRVIHPVGRVLVIDKLFPVYHGEKRAVVLYTDALASLRDALWRSLGLTGYTILRMVGLGIGEKFFETIYELHGDMTPEQYTERLAELLESLGFGRIEVVQNTASDGTVVIRIYDHYECMHLEKKAVEKPGSVLTRGILEGFYRLVWERKTRAVENKCIALGDKYCEFMVEVFIE